MPLSQIVSASIQDGSVAPVDLTSDAQYYAFKNKLINGAMQFWQRGTSFSAPTNLSYTADRWFSIWGTANRTVSRQTGFSGSQYCMRVARTAAVTDAAYSGIVQIIESNNIYDLQGKNVNLSFSARCGSNFSAASNALFVYLQYGTVADQGSGTYWSPGWTGNAYSIATTVALSTTEQTFSLQGLIPSNALEVAVTFQYLSAGTAGANDYFEVTNVQLEKGVTATSFDYRPYGTELALCQRYYSVISATGGSTTVVGYYTTFRATSAHPVTMRATPTVTAIASGTTLNLNSGPTWNALNTYCSEMVMASNAVVGTDFYIRGATASASSEL